MIEFPGARIGDGVEKVGHFLDASAFRRYAHAYRDAAELLPPGIATTVETAYGAVRCYRFDTDGTGVPVVLLAGRNAASPIWSNFLPDLLALGRPVIALDSIGEAGASSQAVALTSENEQTAWVAEVLQQLDLGPVQLVGHSMGGWLAAQVALHHPQAVRALTVLDPPATFAGLRPGFVVAGLVAVLVPSRRVRRRLLGWIAGSTVAGPHGALGLTALETFRGALPPPRRPDPSRLTGLTMPASVVVAGRSTVHAPDKVAHTARSAGWRVEVWTDVGHDLAGASPERLAGTVSATLRVAEDGGGA